MRRFGHAARSWVGLGTVLATGAVAVGLGTPARAGPDCERVDAGVEVPPGFCVRRVAERLGPVRHLAFVSPRLLLAAVRDTPGVLVLRDADGDGRFEAGDRFGPGPGQSVALRRGSLWLSTPDRVVRWTWRPDRPRPAGPPETVVSGFPTQREHAAKAFVLTPDDRLLVSVGAPSNACQNRNRAPRSPGKDPCPERERHAGVWAFPATGAGHLAREGKPVARGMRHTLALGVEPRSGALYGVIHGRDMLSALWGYTDRDNAELPAEELVRIRSGDDFGWPYCYYDGRRRARVLAPEYGGDGKRAGRCAERSRPEMVFPAHWAPMAMVFVRGKGWGPQHHGGAFVAFHGSWNRAPLPQEGFRVVFVPFGGEGPRGTFSTFLRSRPGVEPIRPSGLAVDPDGVLYVAADVPGAIWKVWREPEAPPGPESGGRGRPDPGRTVTEGRRG